MSRSMRRELEFEREMRNLQQFRILFAGDERIGELTSGTLSPSLGVGIGMAYVPAAFAGAGTELAVDIRGRKCPAKVVKKPFLKR